MLTIGELVKVNTTSVGLGWHMKFCMSKKLSDDVDAVGLPTTL